MKLRRIIVLGLLMGLLIALFIPLSVGAATPNADSLTITSCTAYRHYLETNDQIYIMFGDIEYAAYPGVDADEGYFIRLLTGAGVELGTGTIYAYSENDNGYAKFLSVVYFGVADAPAWNDPARIMQLTGNPTITWVDGAPSTANLTPITYIDPGSTDNTTIQIQAFVRARTINLESDWGLATGELIDTGVLTSIGQIYIDYTFPLPRQGLPDLYPAILTQPDFEELEYASTYSNTLIGRLIGTPFDFTTAANQWGMTRPLITGLIAFAMAAFVSMYVAQETRSTKAATFSLFGMALIGALMGFFNLQVIMGIIALFAAFALVYKFVWGRAS